MHPPTHTRTHGRTHTHTRHAVAWLARELTRCHAFPRCWLIAPHLEEEQPPSPWGTWSLLLLGMLLAPAARGIPTLAATLWACSSPQAGTPPIRRAQLRELFAFTLLLSRHSEACALYRLQLTPLHDALQSTVRVRVCLHAYSCGSSLPSPCCSARRVCCYGCSLHNCTMHCNTM